MILNGSWGRRINIFCARNNNLTSKMIVRPKRSLMSIFYFYCWNILEKYFGHKPYTLESSNPFYSLCFWHLGSSHLRPKYSHVHHYYMFNMENIHTFLWLHLFFSAEFFFHLKVFSWKERLITQLEYPAKP